MEDKTEEVERDEGERIGAGPEARDVFAEDHDDAPKAEVDSCSKEGGADGKSNDVPRFWISHSKSEGRAQRKSSWERRKSISIHQERILRERIRVHLHSCRIPDNLQYQATQHRPHEAPCLVLDAENHLRNDENSEDGEVESIAG